MLSKEQNTHELKSYSKVNDLQHEVLKLRMDEPEIKPVDAAHALLKWFQKPDNEFVRLDVLKYAVSHIWKTTTEKLNEVALRDASNPKNKARVAALVNQAQVVTSVTQKRRRQITEAADKAVEQIVSTLKLMTFKQARLMHGATSKLDLSRGSDDQLLGDVFTEDEIRSAVA